MTDVVRKHFKIIIQSPYILDYLCMPYILDYLCMPYILDYLCMPYILFILYINDLANVSDKLKFILFADDTNVFVSGKNIKNVCDVLNKELENMYIWFKVNKLSLNVSKTNYMIFGKKYTDSLFNIQIDGVVVDRVHVTKFLGVLVDDELTWNNHITSVCKNISKNMSMLYKVKHILNSNSLYTLYCSLLLPYFSYACEIWGNTYTSRIE